MPQKRIYIEDGIYFITVNTGQRLPFFKSKILCDLWTEELRFCKMVKKFDLFSFCLNYDHFHLLVRPNKDSNISKDMQVFKSSFSRDANKIMGFNSLLATASSSSLLQNEQRKNRMILDQKIENWHTQFHQKYTNYTAPKFQWQKGFHDQVIRGKKDLLSRHNYCENNFLKHNLSTDWKYTSLNYPFFLDDINK